MYIYYIYNYLQCVKILHNTSLSTSPTTRCPCIYSHIVKNIINIWLANPEIEYITALHLLSMLSTRLCRYSSDMESQACFRISKSSSSFCGLRSWARRLSGRMKFQSDVNLAIGQGNSSFLSSYFEGIFLTTFLVCLGSLSFCKIKPSGFNRLAAGTKMMNQNFPIFWFLVQSKYPLADADRQHHST